MTSEKGRKKERMKKCYEKGRIFFYPCVEEGECGCVEDNAEAVCFYFFISTFSSSGPATGLPYWTMISWILVD
ncbi:hypothetical protein CsSME_00048666 [Camellia sinensis var. sinensis]